MDLHKILNQIAAATTQNDLEKIRIELLGRQGLLNQLFSEIKNQSNPKEYGQELNQQKLQIESAISQKSQNLQPQKTELKVPPSKSVISLPKTGHLHPITITERKLNQLFKDLGFSVYDGPEIENDEYCFQRLNLPADHPARDMQDSIYIQEPDILMRTQTSSIEARLLASAKPPFKTAFPGRVYRNEKVNKSNHFIFHQYQAVVVDKNVTLKDLFGTMDLMFKTLYGPQVVTRYRLKYYPEVEPGVGPDMQCFSCHGQGCPLCKGAGWIEMGGAGIIHPNVLKMANIDPNIWHGFAFGMGLDRWTMANFGITDIRTLTGGNLAYKP
ncbi:hypothetical protein A3K55_00335 [Candidatus Shapirobacteria bacterium RBG_13_44_7]|uniref:phenylalanine--tRNA ligase n=1 Tax=Candidatus Shapirobacteria bacterium RBG_13_44_7 TaxID=1802149 RepID=A0A1F7SKQ2_9BACT|nr:MAG: hypothetical protein A3K55_00335 [Candidatus Shapirobacteria bacterium RBG_13_44_7]